MEAKPRVRIVEVSSVLTPAPGVSLDDAVRDADISGAARVELDRANNRAVVTWHKEMPNG